MNEYYTKMKNNEVEHGNEKSFFAKVINPYKKKGATRKKESSSDYISAYASNIDKLLYNTQNKREYTNKQKILDFNNTVVKKEASDDRSNSLSGSTPRSKKKSTSTNSEESIKKKNLINPSDLNRINSGKLNTKINKYSLKIDTNNYNNKMDVVKEKNPIIDRNKVEQISKCIYTKFPKFETHKKIKLYNIKIAELTLENEKLKNYKDNLEKRILEENSVFEQNFKNYEKAISNALLLGYASLFLCEILNKIIDRDKRFVLRELMKRRDEFKNNILKSYIYKYSVDKSLINNMIMKIDFIYNKNTKSSTILLVSIIKKKIRYFLKFFLNNILKLKEEKGKHSKKKENDKFIFKVSFLNHIEKVENVLGLVKLINTLKTRIYLILHYCFSKLENNKNENLSLRAENITDREKNYNIDLNEDGIKEERIKNINEIENAESNDIKNNCNNVSEIDDNLLFNYKGSDNNTTEKKNRDTYFGEHNKISSKENYLLLYKRNILNDIMNPPFNLDNDNSSNNNYIPHPNEVYNYLYYEELLKLKKSKPEICFDNDNNYNSFLKPLPVNSETSFLYKDLKEYPLTYNSENYTEYIEDKLKKYKNIINEYSKRVRKEDMGLFLNESKDFSGLPKGYFTNKTSEKKDKSIYFFLFNEKRKILKLLEQYDSYEISEKKDTEKNKKEKKKNLNKRKKQDIDNCKKKQLEFLKTTSGKVINNKMAKERVNNSYVPRSEKTDISVNESIIKNKMQTYVISDKKEDNKLNEENYGKKNADNCDLEVESFVNDNIKKKISYNTIKSELKDFIFNIYDNKDDNKDKIGFLDSKIEDIKNKLSKIKEKSFLCVIGEGSPENINLGFNEESQSINKRKEDARTLKKSESKVLFTLKK